MAASIPRRITLDDMDCSHGEALKCTAPTAPRVLDLRAPMRISAILRHLSARPIETARRAPRICQELPAGSDDPVTRDFLDECSEYRSSSPAHRAPARPKMWMKGRRSREADSLPTRPRGLLRRILDIRRASVRIAPPIGRWLRRADRPIGRHPARIRQCSPYEFLRIGQIQPSSQLSHSGSSFASPSIRGESVRDVTALGSLSAWVLAGNWSRSARPRPFHNRARCSRLPHRFAQ